MIGWIVIIALGVALSAYILPILGTAVGLGLLIAFLVVMFRFAKGIAKAIHEDVMELWNKHTGKTKAEHDRLAQEMYAEWERIAQEDPTISGPPSSTDHPTRHLEGQPESHESP